MTIPYNEAGKAAFDVFRRIAERLYTTARAAVDDYTAENFPHSTQHSERHADGQYKRTIRTSEGKTVTVCYDYRKRPSQRETEKKH